MLAVIVLFNLRVDCVSVLFFLPIYKQWWSGKHEGARIDDKQACQAHQQKNPMEATGRSCADLVEMEALHMDKQMNNIY